MSGRLLWKKNKAMFSRTDLVVIYMSSKASRMGGLVVECADDDAARRPWSEALASNTAERDSLGGATRRLASQSNECYSTNYPVRDLVERHKSLATEYHVNGVGVSVQSLSDWTPPFLKVGLDSAFSRVRPMSQSRREETPRIKRHAPLPFSSF